MTVNLNVFPVTSGIVYWPVTGSVHPVKTGAPGAELTSRAYSGQVPPEPSVTVPLTVSRGAVDSTKLAQIKAEGKRNPVTKAVSAPGKVLKLKLTAVPVLILD